MKLQHLTRVVKIAYVWQKYGLDEVLFAIPWLRPFKPLRWLNPAYWFYDRKKSYPERLCLALEALGPLFVKFGQILSTRADLFTIQIASALATLQDNVKPFDGKKARQIIEKALQQPVPQVFSHLELSPLASASVAQVHAATLKDGTDVVVKVLRPHIDKIIKQDISLLYTMARLLDRYWPHTRRLHLVEIVEELKSNLLNELDLTREAANASQLKRNNRNRKEIYIPKIYWDYCRPNIIVMERAYGISIANIAQLKAQNVDLKKVAERGVEIFYTQVFQDCFFHADMHPGNILVNPDNPADPTFILMDFGIIGSLDEHDKHYLAANFLAFFNRDYRRVAQLHIECGWVPNDTKVIELEGAIRGVCEPIFERPASEISMGKTLFALIQMARRFKVEIQPQLILMQKTLLNIEGVGRDLYPQLDLWATAKPFLERWMRQQVGISGFIKRVRQQLPNLSERLPEMPELLYHYFKNQSHHVTPSQPSTTVAVPAKPASRWRSFLVGIGASLLILSSGELLLHLSQQWFTHFFDSHASIMAIIGLICLILGLWRSQR